MLISSIVLIVLRLFCIQWLMRGLVMLASVNVDFASYRRDHPVTVLVPAIVTLLGSIVLWFAAPCLARLVAGKYDATVSVPAPLRDLYAFAFVFLGLYFVIQSLGDAILRFHYALMVSATLGDFNPDRQRTSYELLRSLIILVGGLLCIIFGKTWAAKLAGSKPEA